MPDNKKVSAPIRMPPEMLGKVQVASERTGISQADILRLCLSIGLEDLRRINYDIPGIILNASRQQQESPFSMVAEESSKSKPSPATPSASTPANIAPVKYPTGRQRKKKA